MSDRTAPPGAMPPSVPPSVPPRTSARAGTTTPPSRVSATSVRTGDVDEFRAGESTPATNQRPAVRPEGTAENRAAEDRESDRTGGADRAPRPKPPGPRRVRLAVSRVDPWSVMKLSFLLSIALGIGLVIATATVWTVLNQMGVFAEIIGIIDDVGATNQFGPILEFFEFSRVLSVATVVAVVDIVLLTALATLGAFVYNLVAAMVGGLHLTLTDD